MESVLNEVLKYGSRGRGNEIVVLAFAGTAMINFPEISKVLPRPNTAIETVK